jgi:hypothetical protein
MRDSAPPTRILPPNSRLANGTREEPPESSPDFPELDVLLGNVPNTTQTGKRDAGAGTVKDVSRETPPDLEEWRRSMAGGARLSGASKLGSIPSAEFDDPDSHSEGENLPHIHPNPPFSPDVEVSNPTVSSGGAGLRGHPIPIISSDEHSDDVTPSSEAAEKLGAALGGMPQKRGAPRARAQAGQARITRAHGDSSSVNSDGDAGDLLAREITDGRPMAGDNSKGSQLGSGGRSKSGNTPSRSNSAKLDALKRVSQASSRSNSGRLGGLINVANEADKDAFLGNLGDAGKGSGSQGSSSLSWVTAKAESAHSAQSSSRGGSGRFEYPSEPPLGMPETLKGGMIAAANEGKLSKPPSRSNSGKPEMVRDVALGPASRANSGNLGDASGTSSGEDGGSGPGRVKKRSMLRDIFRRRAASGNMGKGGAGPPGVPGGAHVDSALDAVAISAGAPVRSTGLEAMADATTGSVVPQGTEGLAGPQGSKGEVGIPVVLGADAPSLERALDTEVTVVPPEARVGPIGDTAKLESTPKVVDPAEGEALGEPPVQEPDLLSSDPVGLLRRITETTEGSGQRSTEGEETTLGVQGSDPGQRLAGDLQSKLESLEGAEDRAATLSGPPSGFEGGLAGPHTSVKPLESSGNEISAVSGLPGGIQGSPIPSGGTEGSQVDAKGAAGVDAPKNGVEHTGAIAAAGTALAGLGLAVGGLVSAKGDAKKLEGSAISAEVDVKKLEGRAVDGEPVVLPADKVRMSVC